LASLEEQLQAGLREDVAAQEARTTEFAQATGAEVRGVTQRAGRKARLVRKASETQVMLKGLDRNIGLALDELVNKTGLISQIDQTNFKRKLSERFRKFKILAIKQAQAQQKRAAELGLDQATEQATASAFGGLFGGITAGIIQGLGKKDKGGEAGGGVDTAGAGISAFGGIA